MKREAPTRTPEFVRELQGGEIVRTGHGIFRVIQRRPDETDGRRWARMLSPDLGETDTHVWLEPTWPIEEVLR